MNGIRCQTDGLFSNRALVRLIFPLVMEQALAALVGMCDGVMVSAVGEAAISGVSLVDMINNVILNLFAALATGGAVITSQFLGARRQEEARKSAGQLVFLSAVFGLGIMAACLVLARRLLRLFFGAIAADVMQAGLTYFRITALSFPFLALYNAGAAIFRSTGNSKVSMQASLVMNGINVGGNALCVYGLHMGVAGVAIPTLVSRGVAAGIMMGLASRPKQEVCLMPQYVARLQPDMLRRILGIGVPSALENCLFQLGRVVVVGMIAPFGTMQTSANAVANTLDSIGLIIGQAMGLADDHRGGAVHGRRKAGSGGAVRQEADALGVPGPGRQQFAGDGVFAGAARVLSLPVPGDGGVGPDVGSDSHGKRSGPVAGGLCAAQRPARGGRRALYHGGQRRLHAAVARRLFLDSLRASGVWRRGGVDCHGAGLDLPDGVLPGPVPLRGLEAEEIGGSLKGARK